MPPARCTWSHPRTMTTPELPPLQPWPRRWGPRRNGQGVKRGGALAILGILVLAIVMALTGDNPAQGWVVVGFFALFALPAVGLLTLGSRTSDRIDFVNAVTLGEARTLPPDSWVHLVRERRRSFVFGASLALFGAIVAALGIAAMVLPSDDMLLIRVLVGTGTCALGALFLVGGVRMLRARRRLSSFAESPIGVTFGIMGLGVYGVDVDTYVRWDDITGVVPLGSERSDSARGELVQLRVTRRGASPITLNASSVEVDPLVLLTAIDVFSREKNVRALLSSTRGQALLESWVRQARRA